MDLTNADIIYLEETTSYLRTHSDTTADNNFSCFSQYKYLQNVQMYKNISVCYCLH